MHKFDYIRVYGSTQYGPSTRAPRIPVTVFAETESEAEAKVLAVAPKAEHGKGYYLHLQSIEEIAAPATSPNTGGSDG